MLLVSDMRKELLSSRWRSQLPDNASTRSANVQSSPASDLTTTGLSTVNRFDTAFQQTSLLSIHMRLRLRPHLDPSHSIYHNPHPTLNAQGISFMNHKLVQTPFFVAL